MGKPMIAVECFLDYFIVNDLGVDESQINHESGKGKVLKRLRKGQATIGMVDEDPESYQPRDMDNYKEIKEEDDLKLLQHQQNLASQLIVIPIRLEDWLISQAEKAKVDPQSYGLPLDGRKLHDIPHLEKVPKFLQFWKQLSV